MSVVTYRSYASQVEMSLSEPNSFFASQSNNNFGTVPDVANNMYSIYASYLLPQERVTVQQMVGIVEGFASVTQWDDIIYANADQISNSTILMSSDYVINTPSASKTQSSTDIETKWGDVGAAFYSAYSTSNQVLSVVASNDLMMSKVQDAYLGVYNKLCVASCGALGKTGVTDQTFASLEVALQNNVSIKTDLDSDSFKTLPEFLKDCKAYVGSYTGLDAPNKNTFLICFLPWMIALYIMSFIQTRDIDRRNNTKPNGFLMQIIAMFTFRLYLTQTTMLLMGLTPTTNSGVQTSLATIANYEIDLLMHMLETKDYQKYFDQLGVMLDKNRVNNRTLQETSEKLVKARNNLEKVVANDQLINDAVKKSSIVMYVWLVLFVITAASIIGLLVFANEERPFLFMAVFSVCGGMGLLALAFLFAKMIMST